jgi:membrane associated rhomboid family serine protease
VLNALTCLFVHAGLFHLLGNMLFFFVTGPFLEDLYGRPIFAIFYLVSGIVATMTHALMFSESGIPLVGASGAVAGIMGAFLIRLTKSRMKFLFLPIPIIPTLRFTFHIRAFVFLPFWLGEQLLYASIAPEGGVAWWAHIGGFVFGMIVAAGLKIAHVEERYIDPAIEKQISYSTHPDLEKAIEARCTEQFDKARSHINKVLSDEPNNLDAWAESFNIAIASNNEEEAGRIAAKLLGSYVRAGEIELAFEFGDEAMNELGKKAPAQLYLAMAGLYERERDIRSAIDCYKTAYERSPEDPAGFQALFRCGKLYMRMGNKKTAREVFTQARTHSACLEPEIIDRAIAQLDGLPGRSAN